MPAFPSYMHSPAPVADRSRSLLPKQSLQSVQCCSRVLNPASLVYSRLPSSAIKIPTFCTHVWHAYTWHNPYFFDVHFLISLSIHIPRGPSMPTGAMTTFFTVLLHVFYLRPSQLLPKEKYQKSSHAGPQSLTPCMYDNLFVRHSLRCHSQFRMYLCHPLSGLYSR